MSLADNDMATMINETAAVRRHGIDVRFMNNGGIGVIHSMRLGVTTMRNKWLMSVMAKLKAQ